MNPYKQRDRVIELLTIYTQKNNVLWRVEAPCGMETYVDIILPGPQQLLLYIQYARRSDDLEDTSDISGMQIVRNGTFIGCPSLGFDGKNGMYKDEIRNIPKLLERINNIANMTKNVVVLESRCTKNF